jgi:hypothetical protein
MKRGKGVGSLSKNPMRGVSGPAGTASQRASKAGVIKGRAQDSGKMAAKQGKPLPNNQGR